MAPVADQTDDLFDTRFLAVGFQPYLRFAISPHVRAEMGASGCTTPCTRLSER